ncbi:MAG TPA: HD domain-containing protein [candidate division Zixibacteria bacterium]|nr:HD domain-containing protein [candidate division Zixibacteria bacterium]
MGDLGPTRADALALLEEWNQSPSLRRHGLLVEAGVRGYATDDGLDPETVERWGMAGLLHDLDYERHPDAAQHGAIGADELERRGYAPEVVQAVRSHNDALGIPRTSRLDHLVYACDELSGFLVAVALMRPTKRLADVEPQHVRKRMRDRAFARAVPREMLLAGAEEIGLDFDEHVARMVRYLSVVAPDLGL